MQRPAPGQTLFDRFTLVHELGHGGTGTVWLADDRQLGERVALKMLAAELTASDDSIALLREQCCHASQLSHPNIVRTHEFFAADDRCFISMQYIDGCTPDHRTLGSFREVVACALSLCDALEYAHRAGIVHRDVKLANVLCDVAGHYYLTGFGVAGTLAGDSLPSMSPQQCAGEPATVADDIYGLGALLYELLSGAPLFHPQPTPQRIRTEPPPAVSADQSGDGIPAVLTRLVLAMLDKNPARRPAGIAAVRSVLEEIHADCPVARIGRAVDDTDEAVIRPQRRPGGGGHAEQRPAAAGNAPPRRLHAPKRGLAPGIVYAALGILLAMVIGVVFLLPSVVEQRATRVRETDLQTAPQERGAADAAAGIEPAMVDPAIAAAQRARADEALGALLAAEERLLAVGVESWGGDDWSAAQRLAETGNAAYRERDYTTALSSHRQALDRMRLLESRAPEVLVRALRDGNEALLKRDQNTAIRQFEIALSIQPAQPDAQHGLQRALRLDRVLEFMDQAARALSSDDWQTAASYYRQALELDAEWQPASAGLDTARAAIARARFETQMAAGFGAVQRQDHEQARRAFEAALKIRPGDAAAIEALRQVDADLQLRKIVALRLSARAAESAERWTEAVRYYSEILAIDPKIEAVNRDLQHARERVQLAGALDSALGDADRLYEERVAQQASAVLARAQLIPHPGAKLAGQIEQLDALLRQAAKSVRVNFESDNLTDVVIYKVGRLGVFSARTIDLKPGVYMAVGTRDGYRDVRRSFRVVADGAMPPVIMTCEEPI